MSSTKQDPFVGHIVKSKYDYYYRFGSDNKSETQYLEGSEFFVLGIKKQTWAYIENNYYILKPLGTDVNSFNLGRNPVWCFNVLFQRSEKCAGFQIIDQETLNV